MANFNDKRDNFMPDTILLKIDVWYDKNFWEKLR